MNRDKIASVRSVPPRAAPIMRSNVHALVVTLVGTVAVYLLADVVREAQIGLFENPDPTLFSRLARVWGILSLIIPGVLVAILSNRRAWMLSAAAYCMGFNLNFWYHFDEGDVHRDRWVIFQLLMRHWPSQVGGFLLVAAIGAVVGLAAASLLRRLTGTLGVTR